MRCEQARQLFDAYLDGQLSPSQGTELGAHRLQCAECRRALALLEVSGHILASDRDPVAVQDDFSDRLLACMDVRRARWIRRIPRILYVAGPMAAAAVVALAFFGVFDSNRGGEDPDAWQDLDDMLKELGVAPDSSIAGDGEPSPGPWLTGVEGNVSAIQESGRVLRQLPETILQPLEQLRKAKDTPKAVDPASGSGTDNDRQATDTAAPGDPDDEDK